MAIKDGEVVEADELLSNLAGKQVRNYAQLIFNAASIGFNSVFNWEQSVAFENLEYSIIDGITASTIRADTTMYPSRAAEAELTIPLGWYPATVLDDCNDGAVSGDWTVSLGGAGVSSEGTSTYPEGSTQYIASGSGGAGGDAYTEYRGVNLKAEDSTLYFAANPGYSGSSSDKNYYIYIIDSAGAKVSIWEKTGTKIDWQQFYSIKFDVSDESCIMQMWGDGSTGPTSKDLSSLNGTWYIQFKVTNNNSSNYGFWNIYFLNYVVAATGPFNFVSNERTTSATITDAILVANSLKSTNAIATYYLSADGGSNYEEVTLNQIHRFTDTGTALRVKVIGDPNMQTDEWDYLFSTEWAVFYNTGAE